MNNVSWKWLAMVALIALLALSGKASVQVGGTDAQTGQPSTVEVPPVTAGDQALDQTTDGLLASIPQLLSAAALGGFVAAIMNLGKLFPGAAGKLDGKTGTITTLINVVVLAIVTVAGYFGYADKVKLILEQTGNAIPGAIGLITTLGGVLSALGGSSAVHALMKKINVTAFSFSARPIAAPPGG